MGTYSFAEKNSSCVLVMTADNEEQALDELRDKVKHPQSWRMEVIEEQDGEE